MSAASSPPPRFFFGACARLVQCCFGAARDVPPLLSTWLLTHSTMLVGLDDATVSQPLALPLPALGRSDAPPVPLLPLSQGVGGRSSCESSRSPEPADLGDVPGRHPYHGQEHGKVFSVFSNEFFLYQHAIPIPHTFTPPPPWIGNPSAGLSRDSNPRSVRRGGYTACCFTHPPF